MADKEQTLGELITARLKEDVALLTWIAGLNDRALAVAYRRISGEYDTMCYEYEEHGELPPCGPRSLPMLQEAMLQRLEC